MLISKSIPWASMESLKIPICVIFTILFGTLCFAYFRVWSIFTVIGFVFLLVLIPNLFLSFLIFTCFLPYIGSADADIFLKYFNNIWLYAYGVLAASWIYHVFTQPKRIYVNVPLTLLFLSYLLVCLLSLFGSFDLSTIEASDIGFNPYRRVLEVLLTSSLLVFSMSAFEKEYQLEKIFWVIILTGIPLSILVLFIGEFGHFWREYESVGIFMGQHTAAQYIFFCTIMAFYLYRSTYSRKKRFFLICCFVLFLIIEIIILSRTISTSLLLVILLSFLFEGKIKKLLYLLIVFVIAFFVLYPFLPESIRSASKTVFTVFIGDVDTSIIASTDVDIGLVSPNIRLNDIKVGLELANRNPLLGVGIGKSMLVEEVMYRPATLLHNYYINVLVETGILGLSVFLAIIFLTIFMACRSLIYFRKIGNFKMYFLTKGLLLSTISIIIIFFSMPGWAEGERILFVLIGLIAVVDKLRDRNKQQMTKRNNIPHFHKMLLLIMLKI
jgi:O-antigen ligase